MPTRVLLAVLLLSSTPALAVEDVPPVAGEDPAGDPPPPPAPIDDPPGDRLDPVDEVPLELAPEAEAPALPAPEPTRPTRVRRRGPTPLEALGRSAAAGAAAAVVGAAGAAVVGGGTVATAVSLERTNLTPEGRSVALLVVLGGALATPFAAALAASLATLFVTRPTAAPEEYADLTMTCLSCAAAAACAGLCLVGGGPAMVLSPSCSGPAMPPGRRGGEVENPAALAAGVGAALGAVGGAAAAWYALTSYPPQDTLTSGAVLVGGSAGGAALGGLLVGSAAVLVEQWRYVELE